jgi:hypothetical protein
VIVLASIACENVAVTNAPTATPVAPLAGDVDETVGGVPPVENVQVYCAASGVPSDALIVVSSFAV